MIRIGIMGYGNLGRGIECAIKQNDDLELVAVFTRRDPATVSILTEGAAVCNVKDIEEWKDKIDAYLDALIKELKALGRMAGERKPDTVYVGGGTPTTLEAGQLDRLLGTIRNCFDLSELKEFTVEAGRPDSITREKLEVIRRYPVTRISVNPQTMQQKTLDLVGRKHTVEDVERIFHMARELGFDNINMDLIAGLPGETRADMQLSLIHI